MLNKKLLASTASKPPEDDNFQNVSLLLSGDGTNGAQNNTFVDSSTNNFTITRNGNTTQGSFSPYGTLWSNNFNGSSMLTAASSSDWTLGTGDFTIEAWMFATSLGTSNYPTIVSNMSNFDSGYTNRFALTLHSSGIVWYNTVGNFGLQSNSAPQLNVWTHVAIVRSSSTISMYVNGVAQTQTQTSNQDYSTTNELYIGGIPFTSTSARFIGNISNLRIVKGSAVYTSNFTPSTTPLTAFTNTTVLTCQSNRFVDNSSTGRAITVSTGSPSVQRFSPFNPTAPYSTSVIGGSGYFDGSGDYLRLADNSAFQLGSGDFTLETWVYLTAAPPIYDASLLSYGTTGNFNGWQLALTNASTQGRLIFSFNFSTVVTSTLATKLNSWNHVAVSRSGNTLYLFINGVLDSSNSFTATSNTGGADFAYINTSSYDPGSSDRTPAGYLCGSRLVKGTCLYTSTFTLPTAPVSPVTNTSYLLGYTNAGIPDLAMQNNLETVGNAQVSTSVKKYGTGSLAFDGTGDYLLSAATQVIAASRFTVEAWLYKSSTNEKYAIAQGTSGNAGRFAIGVASTNWFVQIGSASVNAGSVSTNTWTHIAVTYDGATLTLYVNGTSVGTASTTQAVQNTTLRLGTLGADWSTIYEWDGYMDDIRITNGVIRYTTTFTPPASALPTY